MQSNVLLTCAACSARSSSRLHGVAVVACYSFYGSDPVFLDEEFTYFCDVSFAEVFAVDWSEFGFGEEVVAVEAFVELVLGAIFSVFDYFFSFFF